MLQYPQIPLSFSNFFISYIAYHLKCYSCSVFWFWFSMLKICFHVFHLIWWLFWPRATLKVLEVTYFCCIFCRFNFVIMLVYLMLWDQTLTQANFALISSRVWLNFWGCHTLFINWLWFLFFQQCSFFHSFFNALSSYSFIFIF